MTHASVVVHSIPTAKASLPSWIGELVVIVQRFKKHGLLQELQEKVRLGRGRMGQDEVIDFLAVLFAYAVSGEPTFEAFHARLSPFADLVMSLFERRKLPHPSTVSRFLEDVDASCVQALRALFLQDLIDHIPFPSQGGLWDREGKRWRVIDIDGTKHATRQRALFQGPEAPQPRRRMTSVCAKGYFGRKRGEVGRTRTTVLQSQTHQWIGTFSGAGNGDYRGELQQALAAIKTVMTPSSLPLPQVLIRLDGLYGNAAVIAEILQHQVGIIVRCKEYGLLDLPVVQARLQRPADQQVTHLESGSCRTLFDCPDVLLTTGGPRVRLLIATHSHRAKKKPAVGHLREATVYERFVTTAPTSAFPPSDVLGLYLHRGSFDTVLADEDREQNTDRWMSHAACGQEWWQIVNQWVWNLRLEFGQHLTSQENPHVQPVFFGGRFGLSRLGFLRLLLPPFPFFTSIAFLNEVISGTH